MNRTLCANIPLMVALFAGGLWWWSVADSNEFTLKEPLLRTAALMLCAAAAWRVFADIFVSRGMPRRMRALRLVLNLWALSPTLFILAFLLVDLVPSMSEGGPTSGSSVILWGWFWTQVFVSWWVVPLLSLVAGISFKNGGATPTVLTWVSVPIILLIAGIII